MWQKWRLKPTKRVAGNGDLTWNRDVNYAKYDVTFTQNAKRVAGNDFTKNAWCEICQITTLLWHISYIIHEAKNSHF